MKKLLALIVLLPFIGALFPVLMIRAGRSACATTAPSTRRATTWPLSSPTACRLWPSSDMPRLSSPACASR